MFYNLFFARFLFHFTSKPQPYPRSLLFCPFRYTLYNICKLFPEPEPPASFSKNHF